MRHLIAPMDSEAPADYLSFVVRHLTAAQDEAARLVGGDGRADEVCGQALEDVALRWRFLDILRRLGRPDRSTSALGRSLMARARRWRDDQIYPVEVRVLGHPSFEASVAASIAGAAPRPAQRRVPAVATSLALRKASLLGDTARAEARPLAEAGIAWVHAYERHRRLKIIWIGVAVTVVACLILGAMPAPT